ncbi:MAG: hypothetical protein CL910_14220 [Deltaproteobacteria bacterium]|jgi:NADPH:quinone reductase-like Zn-dependent oxidoreductase|nr:hypothetical protein [Deltaproteobacteria bacterium]
MSNAPGLDFLVDRKDWKRTRFVESQPPGDLGPGQVRFRVDRFAFTANNVSYALSGDMLGYWNFFPAEEGWGRIPTMGFGDVIASRHEGVAVGTRCFGFYPMSRYLVIEPREASPRQIVDGVAHREGLAPAYNQYSPVDRDSLYRADQEDELILLRGLFMTSFLAEDFLVDQELGEKVVLITSASSKTSIALAHQVAKRGQAKAVGLTSAGHLDFAKGLGCYDQVILYDEIGSLPADVPTMLVDMAGNERVVRSIHEHYQASLLYSCAIGATHWEATGSLDDLPGPKREFFFAPGQIQKRIQDWGAAGFQKRLGASWSGFADGARSWLTVTRGAGRKAVETVYQATLAGEALPSEGHVLTLWD